MEVQSYNGVCYTPGSRIDMGLRACVPLEAKMDECKERQSFLLADLRDTSAAILAFSPWGDPGDLAALIARKAALEILTGEGCLIATELENAANAATIARARPIDASSHIKALLESIRLAIVRETNAPTNTVLSGHVAGLKGELLSVSGMTYEDHLLQSDAVE